MIKYYLKTIKGNGLTELESFKTGSWIHVENPSDVELDFLAQKFPLDRGLLADGLDLYENPRIEREKKVIYVYTRTPYRDTSENIYTLPVLIILGQNFTLTLTKGKTEIFDSFLAGKYYNFYTTQKNKFLLQILTVIDQKYNQFLNSTSRRINSFRNKIQRIENRDILNFVEIEIILNEFLNALMPSKYILNNLLAKKQIELFQEDENILEDLILSNDQLIDRCQNNLKNITNFREAYDSVLSNRLNRTMKLLTTATVLLAVPNVVTSFYGMNIHLPGSHNNYAYIFVTLFILIMAGTLLFTFRKGKWL